MSPNPALQCPRDGAELIVEHLHGIEVDHCGTCNGRWLDRHELDDLEATKADEGVRRGTIRYSERDSDLGCPVCGEQMAAFNYRAYDLELGHLPQTSTASGSTPARKAAFATSSTSACAA